MRNFRKILTVFLTIGISIGAIYMIVTSIDQDLKFGDGFALFGGGQETGYPSAGYLISYEASGGFKTCGYSALTNNIGITAGHCVDKSEQIEIGKGLFNLSSGANINVLKGIQKEGWVENKERINDFAILIFNAPIGYFSDFAEIGSPELGCKYRVVAYGRTESDSNTSLERPRKSAKMCITKIDGNIFFMTSDEEAGICFGDSGSPIYEDGTNKVIGVTASIVNSSSKDPNSPCDFNNTAIGVRTDLNSKLVDENKIAALEVLPGDAPVATPIDLEVAEETFLDKIGLGNFSNSQLSNMALYGGGAFLSLVVIIGLWTYTKRQ